MSELKLLNWKERASYVAGWTMLITVAPLVGCVVFATVLWEAIDARPTWRTSKTRHALDVPMGSRPQTGGGAATCSGRR
jgi:hypothetical protein